MYLTYETALEALEKAVADRGEEYIYPKPAKDSPCMYWHRDEQAPGCLIGLALHQLGVSGEALEGFGASTLALLAMALPNLEGIELSRGATELMARAQLYQDRAMPWGQALRYAVAETEQIEARRAEARREAESWQLTSA